MRRPTRERSPTSLKAGLTGTAQGHYRMGAAVGDYDNDSFATST